MVIVPVTAVNCSRPYSRGALILKAIMPLRENKVWPCKTKLWPGNNAFIGRYPVILLLFTIPGNEINYYSFVNII